MNLSLDGLCIILKYNQLSRVSIAWVRRVRLRCIATTPRRRSRKISSTSRHARVSRSTLRRSHRARLTSLLRPWLPMRLRTWLMHLARRRIRRATLSSSAYLVRLLGQRSFLPSPRADKLAGLFGSCDDVLSADRISSCRLEDMMSILFPHLTEDLEYLVPSPEEEVGNATAAPDVASSSSAPSGTRRVQMNAVAGPSRLR